MTCYYIRQTYRQEAPGTDHDEASKVMKQPEHGIGVILSCPANSFKLVGGNQLKYLRYMRSNRRLDYYHCSVKYWLQMIMITHTVNILYCLHIHILFVIVVVSRDYLLLEFYFWCLDALNKILRWLPLSLSLFESLSLYFPTFRGIRGTYNLAISHWNAPDFYRELENDLF